MAVANYINSFYNSLLAVVVAAAALCLIVYITQRPPHYYYTPATLITPLCTLQYSMVTAWLQGGGNWSNWRLLRSRDAGNVDFFHKRLCILVYVHLHMTNWKNTVYSLCGYPYMQKNHIWVNFPRTGKMVKMWHFFNFFELCCDQMVWYFQLFATVPKRFCLWHSKKISFWSWVI